MAARLWYPPIWIHAGALVPVFLGFALAQSGGTNAKPTADDPPIGKAKILFYEDFEAAPTGQIPRGYSKAGAVYVVENMAHTGHKSLRIDAAPNGPRRITFSGGALTQLGGSHWGRLYFKVQLPAPECKGGVIHSTIVAAKGKSPLHNDPIEVRPLDTILNSQQKLSFIYNVQPERRGEFASGSQDRFKYTDEWTLAEWYVDSATQTYRLFIDGKEVRELSFQKGSGKYENAEIPDVFESMSFGWYNYQNAGQGFVAWIDDIALAKERIGPTPPPGQKREPPREAGLKTVSGNSASPFSKDYRPPEK